MSRKSIILLSSIVVLFLLPNNAYTSDQLEISTLVNGFFKNISQKDYVAASKLFHYPPNYTKEEVNKDIVGVSMFLKALDNSFGEINNPTIHNGNNKIISLQIAGGDIPYWKKNPNYLSNVFSVNFSKYGSGYVTITLCNLNNRYEIREAKYGLDASFKNSITLLQDAAKHIRLVLENNE